MPNHVTIVLVHGAWHGGWCWDAVVERLEADGIATAVVENPSVTHPGSDLHADGDNLTATLDALDGPVLLVGHSYGGAVITDAGAHPNVAHLVYLAAFPLEAGESVIQNALTGGEGGKLGEAMQVDGGLVTVEPSRIVEFFFHDCAPEVAAAASARLRPMALAAMGGVPRSVAWREKPSTYIVCTDDRAVPVGLQRSAALRTTNVIEMATSHSPFFSRPDELARILADIAATL